jgi:hypothetical protein
MDNILKYIFSTEIFSLSGCSFIFIFQLLYVELNRFAVAYRTPYLNFPTDLF